MAGILIVDDLPVIRSGVVRCLEQHLPHLKPFIQAADGLEAVTQARAYKPDIILMDIKMPIQTGLQAMALIKAEQPDVKVVMMTAYNEFAFVQKALQLGARDYLLKPIRPRRLVEIIQTILDEIQHERRDLKTIEIVKDSLQKTLPVIEANLVENLIRGTTPIGENIDEALGFLGKLLIRPTVIVAKIDQYEAFAKGRSPAQLQKIFTQLVDTVRQALPEPNRSVACYSYPGRVVAIVSCHQALASADKLYALGQHICEKIADLMPFTVTIGLGNAYNDWESVPFSYAEANLARRLQSRISGNNTVHIDAVQALTLDKNDANFYRVRREQELVECVRNNYQQRAAQLTYEIIDYLVQRFKATPDFIDAIKNNCAELITLAAWAVIGTGCDEREPLEVLHTQVNNLKSWKTLPEVRAWTMNSLEELTAVVQARSQSRNPLEEAVAYIQANYRRSDISLQEVAKRVNLSQSYLGSQFKAHMGTSYVKCLTTLRIQEAKRLLRTTDHNVAYIAESVGYPNVTNFYRHFQRQVGNTPAAYRQSSI